MADYTPPPGMKNRKKDKDPNKPKRNMSAYFSYDATTNTKDDAILSFCFMFKNFINHHINTKDMKLQFFSFDDYYFLTMPPCSVRLFKFSFQ